MKALAADCDLVLVVGSPNSSNSNRLRELAARIGSEAHLIDSAEDIDPKWLAGKQRIGITAGASAPDVLVQQVIERLQSLGASAPVEAAELPSTSHSLSQRIATTPNLKAFLLVNHRKLEKAGVPQVFQGT